jgi:mRNA interferase MazF
MVNEISQGDVYWVDFGQRADSAAAERHPCVVVQCDLFNRSRIGTTMVCLITSNLRRAQAPGNVALNTGDANLPKPGVVSVSQVLTVNKGDLGERLGKLPASVVDSIRAGLELLFNRI